MGTSFLCWVQALLFLTRHKQLRRKQDGIREEMKSPYTLLVTSDILHENAPSAKGSGLFRTDAVNLASNKQNKDKFYTSSSLYFL
jgi:hypothetical protein